MPNMIRRFMLGTCLVMAVSIRAHATDLRLYPQFAEVREPVTINAPRFTTVLPDGVLPGLLPGSIELRGIGFTQMTQDRTDSWLKTYEGTTLKLIVDGNSEAVTLVRASDLTVRDAAGDYRRVTLNQLTFPTLPPEAGVAGSPRLTFDVTGSGPGMLQYLTRSLSWSPRFTLSAAGSHATLEALADLRNTSLVPYTAQTTELFSGEVGLARNPQQSGVPVTTLATAIATGDSEDMARTAPAVNPMTSVGGLYRYALDRPVLLPPQGAVTLPFLQTNVTLFDRSVSLNTYFTPASQRGALNRTYRITVDQALPGGVMTVREEGRVVGQTLVRESEKGERIEFVLGRDPEVRYRRDVKVVEPGERGSGTFDVTYVFENARDRVVRAEVTELVSGRTVTLGGVEKTSTNSALLKVDVPAKGKATKTFTVMIENY